MTRRSHEETRNRACASAQQELAARHRARETPYRLRDTRSLVHQRSRESQARSYPRRLPIALRRGQGVYVEDEAGHVYIDCLAGAGALSLGHNHPRVLLALSEALDSGLPMQTLDLMTPVKDAFVEALLSLFPAEFAARARVQFCGPTGTDAVEAALKLVRTATGRKTLWAFRGGYHGMSQGSLSLMGNLGPKAPLDGVLGGAQFFPFPYGYRCPFGLGGELGERVAIRCLQSALRDPESGMLPPAGVILEALQGEGGVLPAPPGFLRALRELTQDSEIPLILDEVQTGFGRTGQLFAFEESGITPDVVVLSKAVGGGLPLSVVVYDQALDVWSPGAHAGTFRGNQLGMVAGLAAIEVLRAEQLEVNARERGEQLLQQLRALQAECSCIGEVRGRGLMLGMELVDPAGAVDALGHPPASAEVAAEVQARCLRRGLIVEVGGRHGATVRLLPPLVITADEVGTVTTILGEVLHEVQTGLSGTNKVAGSASHA